MYSYYLETYVLRCSSSNTSQQNDDNENTEDQQQIKEDQMNDFLAAVQKNNIIIHSKGLDLNCKDSQSTPFSQFNYQELYKKCNQLLESTDNIKNIKLFQYLSGVLNNLLKLQNNQLIDLGKVSGIWPIESYIEGNQITHIIKQSDYYKNNTESKNIDKLPEVGYSELSCGYVKDSNNIWCDIDFSKIDNNNYWKDSVNKLAIQKKILIYQFDKKFIKEFNKLTHNIIVKGLKNNGIFVREVSSTEYLEESMLSSMLNLQMRQFIPTMPSVYNLFNQFYFSKQDQMLVLGVAEDVALVFMKDKSKREKFSANKENIVKNILDMYTIILKHILEPHNFQTLIQRFLVSDSDKNKKQFIDTLARILLVQVLAKYNINITIK